MAERPGRLPTMALSNDEIFAWVQRSLDDPGGVTAVVAALDVEEARETAVRLLSYFGAFVHSQNLHIDELNAAFIGNPQWSPEERLSVLLTWLKDFPIGSVGLAKTMQGLDEYRAPPQAE